MTSKRLSMAFLGLLALFFGVVSLTTFNMALDWADQEFTTSKPWYYPLVWPSALLAAGCLVAFTTCLVIDGKSRAQKWAFLPAAALVVLGLGLGVSMMWST